MPGEHFSLPISVCTPFRGFFFAFVARFAFRAISRYVVFIFFVRAGLPDFFRLIKILFTIENILIAKGGCLVGVYDCF